MTNKSIYHETTLLTGSRRNRTVTFFIHNFNNGLLKNVQRIYNILALTNSANKEIVYFFSLEKQQRITSFKSYDTRQT